MYLILTISKVPAKVYSKIPVQLPSHRRSRKRFLVLKIQSEKSSYLTVQRTYMSLQYSRTFQRILASSVPCWIPWYLEKMKMDFARHSNPISVPLHSLIYERINPPTLLI